MLKTAAIGDTILISGIVADIAEAYPDAELVFFAGSSNFATAELCMPQRVQKVLIPIKSPMESVAIIRQTKFDLFIDFGPWPRIDALLACFARAGFIMGFRNAGQHRHSGFDASAPHSSNRHEYLNYKALVQLAGVHGNHFPEIPFSRPAKKINAVAMHMFPGGSRAALREWPQDRWAALVEHYTNQGIAVYLTGAGRGNAERIEDLRNRAAKSRLIVPFVGNSLRDTADLLQKMLLVYSVDTGIMHMASAVGCNLVSLHGPTPASRWGPLNPNSIKLEPGPACLRCGNLGFEDCVKKRQCINDITLEAAIAAGESFMKQAEAGQVRGA